VHEERVADEHVVTDPVGDVRRRMAGNVHHLHLERTEGEAFAVAEQEVEVAALGL